MDEPVVARLKMLYSHFDESILPALEEIYSTEVVFSDPVQQVIGLGALRHYFRKTMEGLEECRFEFSETLTQLGADGVSQTMLAWTMFYRHPKLASGRLLSLQGNTHIKHSDKIFYHRDYYDMGAMLYEHIPLVRSIVRHIKKRLEG